MNISKIAAIMIAATLAGTACLAAERPKQAAQEFATKAASANMFEIEAAKVEAAKGKDGPAKQFAADMLKDHGKAGPELEAAAKADGVTVPTSIDADSKKEGGCPGVCRQCKSRSGLSLYSAYGPSGRRQTLRRILKVWSGWTA